MGARGGGGGGGCCGGVGVRSPAICRASSHHFTSTMGAELASILRKAVVDVYHHNDHAVFSPPHLSPVTHLSPRDYTSYQALSRHQPFLIASHHFATRLCFSSASFSGQMFSCLRYIRYSFLFVLLFSHIFVLLILAAFFFFGIFWVSGNGMMDGRYVLSDPHLLLDRV